MNAFIAPRILVLDNDLQQEIEEGWLATLGLPWQTVRDLAGLQAACLL